MVRTLKTVEMAGDKIHKKPKISNVSRIKESECLLLNKADTDTLIQVLTEHNLLTENECEIMVCGKIFIVVCYKLKFKLHCEYK